MKNIVILLVLVLLGCSKEEFTADQEPNLVAVNFFSSNNNIQAKLRQVTEEANFSARAGHSTVVFNNKLWLLNGADPIYRQDVRFSDDGQNWGLFTGPVIGPVTYPRAHHNTLVKDNKMWIIGGLNSNGTRNDVLYSSNGENWQYATFNAGFSKRHKAAGATFNNKLWIIGGLDQNGLRNDVWSSIDGITWTLENANAAFSPRMAHACVVFDNKLWVIGGNSGGTINNDVWFSEDGVNWSRSNATERSKVFTARQFHSVTQYKKMLWLVGGQGGDNVSSNKIWNSKDGKDWTLVSTTQALIPRSSHTSTVFNDELLIIGGRDAEGQLLNDVWALEN